MLEAPDGGAVAAVEQADRDAVAAGTGSQAAQMDGSAGNLVKAAGGGGFKLDPQAAAQLAASCQTAIDHILDMENDLTNIEEAPKLGSLQGAQSVANYTQNVATDPQGMLQAIRSLRATLTQMHDAYIQASTNYQETNEQIADVLKKIDPDHAPTSAAPPSSGPPPSSSAVAANQNFN